VKTRECGSCGAKIIWAVTVNDKRMPVDAEPNEKGNIELIDRGFIAAIVHSQPPLAAETLYTSHFVTCPNAEKHRK
jgi:hypothetical protein